MSLELTVQDEDELWEAAEQQRPPVVSDDGLETIYRMPPQLGNGYSREVKLQSGAELCVFDSAYHEQVILRTPENQHLVQFVVHLSGTADSGDSAYHNSTRGYIGGSGIQRPIRTTIFEGERLTGISIHLPPLLLLQLFGNGSGGALPPELQLLIPGADRPQQVFSPRTTATIRSVVRHMIHCPYVGMTKQLYLQGKMLELMALQLADVAAPCDNQWALKPETMAQVRQAAVMLRSCLDNPPDQTTLAQQVGVSNSTLQRGFKQLFGTTVLGYLTEQRLILAERLLRDTDMTVTEVVHCSGYSNPGHFAAAFKRQFGITPKQCALGMLSEGNG